jgi:hypothetical protein
MVRIDDCASQNWAATPHRGNVMSIVETENFWVRVLSFSSYWRYTETTIFDTFNAELIIKYSVIFSAVMMPTNCPAWVTGSAGTPDS